METGKLMSWIGTTTAAAFALSMATAPAVAQVPAGLSGVVTPNTIFFYDYAAGTTTTVPDISGNGWDLEPGESAPATVGTFSYGVAGAGPIAGAPTLDTNLNGGLTVSPDPLGHQAISDAGGFFFETWVKRDADTPGQDQILWSPEGLHSIEFLGTNDIQLAVRGQGISQDGSPGTKTTLALPIGEWHHIAAVFTVTTPLPGGGDPAADPLIGDYALYIDGIQSGVTILAKDINAIGWAGLETTGSNPDHGIGGTNWGTPGYQFRGELANTQLALLPEPASAALLGLGGLLLTARRR